MFKADVLLIDAGFGQEGALAVLESLRVTPKVIVYSEQPLGPWAQEAKRLGAVACLSLRWDFASRAVQEIIRHAGQAHNWGVKPTHLTLDGE